MWDCNFAAGIPWTGYFGFRGFFSLLILGLMIFLIIFFILKAVKRAEGGNSPNVSDRHDSLEILKIRYARGELDNAEFNKMKQILL